MSQPTVRSLFPVTLFFYRIHILFVFRSHISDVMCCVALFGIIVMIIENEITFANSDPLHYKITFFLQLINTLLTAILVILVFTYHYYDLNLYCINNSIDDWRVGLTFTRVMLIVIEVIVCAIHPFPRHYPTNTSQSVLKETNSSIIEDHNETDKSFLYIYFDVALGLPSEKLLNCVSTLVRLAFFLSFKCFFDFTCLVDS